MILVPAAVLSSFVYHPVEVPLRPQSNQSLHTRQRQAPLLVAMQPGHRAPIDAEGHYTGTILALYWVDPCCGRGRAFDLQWLTDLACVAGVLVLRRMVCATNCVIPSSWHCGSFRLYLLDQQSFRRIERTGDDGHPSKAQVK